jgi:hypothetical protein
MMSGAEIPLLAFLLAGAKAPSHLSYFPPAFSAPAITCPTASGPKKLPLLSDLENEWFSDQLAAAHEPVLYPSSASEQLRFTWIPSFDHTVTVRVIGLGSSNPQLIAKKLSGQGGYEPGVIANKVVRPLSRREATMLRALVSDSHVLDASSKLCGLGVDGSEWLIEGTGPSGYHFVARWSPENGSVRELGLVLLRLTGWKFKEIY